MKIKALFAVLVFSSSVFAVSNVNAAGTELKRTYDNSLNHENMERVEEWTEYNTYGGIKVEYKFTECNVGKFKNQIWVLLRYTNLTTKKLGLTWKTEIYRNGECENCSRIESDEHSYEIKLNPNEVIEGECGSIDNRALYIFGNYITLSPGMSKHDLTDFKFINVQTFVWK